MAESEVIPPVEAMGRLIGAGLQTHVVRAFAQLRLADRFGSDFCEVAWLAEATECHAASLERLLRAATSLGLCTTDGTGRFRLTPVGATLRRGRRTRWPNGRC